MFNVLSKIFLVFVCICMYVCMCVCVYTLPGERDEFMANSLAQCGAALVVGVVGAGHLDGIERCRALKWALKWCREAVHHPPSTALYDMYVCM